MIDRAQYGNTYGPLEVANNAIKLPNDMFLKYPHLMYSAGEFVYQSSSNRGLIRTHGPRLCENIIQALARIVITNQILTIKKELPNLDIVLTVHDEIICSGPEENAEVTLEQIMAIMKRPPGWCEKLPLDAEGGYSKVYDK
jgi:DNA polymerase I-like protein with 3'-5' exonuclease and polymerase domains